MKNQNRVAAMERARKVRWNGVQRQIFIPQTCEHCGASFFRKLRQRFCSTQCHYLGTSKTWEQRFWSYVQKTSNCWIWMGSKRPSGYGRLWVNGKTEAAHRLSFYLAHGYFSSKFVCHHCDNPLCVNPDHLFEGTVTDNVQDSISKDRWPHGDTHQRTILTEAIRKDIIKRYKFRKVTQADLALEFGVDTETVGKVIRQARKQNAGVTFRQVRK